MSRWLRHIIFWIVVYILWTYMKSPGVRDLTNWFVNIVQVGAYAALYYMLSEVLIPRLFDRRRYFLFGSCVIAFTIGVLFIWSRILIYLSGFLDLHPSTLPWSVTAYILEGVQMFVPGMILLAWESYDLRQVEEENLHQIEKENLASELNYLKAQLNPQFLFSTLRNLKAKIDSQSPHAQDMILRLSEVLDYILYRSQQDFLPLREEVAVIKNYLELERLRVGQEHNITFEAIGDLSVPISPLVLMSLVEDILKVPKDAQDEILQLDIHLTSGQDKIVCDIFKGNYKKSHQIENDIHQIHRQLKLTYPDRYVLRQDQDAAGTRTSLTLIPAYA